MKLPKSALNIISMLENGGYEAYAVGGCVRDFILNKKCDDIDITTSATPDEMKVIFDNNGVKYYETGILHGTLTALISNDSFEITTFRTDGRYFDSRHPESVRFVSDISEDLSRRDFTVNALAYNDRKGIVDMFGGKEDIKNRIIRTVGDPDKRFREDALRIIRAIRFSSVLSFDIEEKTKKAIFENKELLKNVSYERIYNELSKLLMGNNVYNVLVDYKEVIAVVIPELEYIFNIPQNTKWHIYDVWHHTAKSVEQSKKDLAIRYIMLFHDIGKAFTKTTDANGTDHFKGHQKVSGEYAVNIFSRLKAPNYITDRAMAVIPIHDIHIGRNKKNIKKWLSKIGKESLNDLIEVKKADKLAQNLELTKEEIENLNTTQKNIEEIIKAGEAFSVKDLSVNGNDLIKLGLKGREIGEMLGILLDNVIEEKVKNDKEELLEYVKKARE